VTAYAVSQRRREFGLRFALGAGRAQVLWLVLGRAAVLALSGLAIGCIVALWAARFLGSQLYAVSPGDPPSYLAGAIVVLLLSLAASWLPAARAARINPVDSLREG
jgi:ABC-type antimicrobial peptide transport system permease subunit